MIALDEMLHIISGILEVDLFACYLCICSTSFTWHTVAATVLCCGTVFSSRLQNWDSHTIKAFSHLDELLKHDFESPSNNKEALFSVFISFSFFEPLSELFPLALAQPIQEKEKWLLKRGKMDISLFFA